MNSNLSIISKNQGNLQYSHYDLEYLETFFDQCFENSFLCDTSVNTHYQITKNSIFSEDCQYYLNIFKLMTICFGINRELRKGFVNSTIFSVAELRSIYKIIRYFALEEWAELTPINSHAPYRKAVYEND
jgi:hypothetical protein